MPPSALSASSKTLPPWLVAVAFFMESLDPTILNPAVIIGGIHEAFFALGGFTILSALAFAKLKRGDGADVSERKAVHAL